MFLVDPSSLALIHIMNHVALDLNTKHNIDTKVAIGSVGCHDWPELCENTKEFPDIFIKTDQSENFEPYKGLIEQNIISSYLLR